jgi:type I restriction enzyme M protein
MAAQNTAEIGFEKEIWDAACVLRGNIDAAEYKHVVLGLIFLKYLSDKFEERYRALKDEGEGFEEDRDAYAEKQVFYVPPSARTSTTFLFSARTRTPPPGNSAA